ncbi:MAG: ABC transporter permease [Sedimentisphaerales bacterium]|nr:ABC transporter permease [Sedimentisphaerales bacterium]
MKELILAPLMFVRLVYQSAYLALGQIWANKTRSILTTIGIVIGVASVTAVIAALTGLKAKILSQVETLGSNTIFVQPQRPNTGPKSSLPWWQIRFKEREFEGLLEHCPSVEMFARMCWAGQYTVKFGEKSVQNVEVRGVESAWHKIEKRTLVAGRELSVIDEGRSVCLIEPVLRDKLGLDRECGGESIRIGYRTFRVIGVIDKPPDLGFGDGGQERYEIIVPFKTASKLNQWPWIMTLAASRSTELSEEAVAELKFFLRRMRDIKAGEPDTFRVESLKSALQTFNNISLVVTLVAGGIVGISLLVGGVGIMNIMLVSISERTKEIGLRKAVGAKRSAILTQFLVEAVILCFVGGLVGVGVGKLLTFAIAHLNPLLEKTYIPAWAIVLSFAFAGTVGICFGMFPAIKAARLDPIEALRHE